MTKQVFFDPQRKRWKRLRRIFDVVAVIGVVVGVLFVIGLVRMTPLPELLLATPRHDRSAVPQLVATPARGGHLHASQDHPETIRRDSELGRRSARRLLR
jgi:hypothetical protein